MKVSETSLKLKRMLNSDNNQVRQKLAMLILIREGEDYIKRYHPTKVDDENIKYSKRYLAEKVGVSGTTILAWKRKYEEGGLGYLLEEKIQHLKITEIVEERTLRYMRYNPHRLSFTEIYKKVKEEFPEVQYSTLIKHIKANCKTLYELFLKEKKESKKVNLKR